MRDPFGWPRGPFPVRLGAPALDLNFLTGVMPAGLTYTRASTATYIGSDGLLKTAAVDEPRFDYDPITLACKGLLIEGSRTNVLLSSDGLDSANWTKERTTISPNATTAPNGTLNADKLVEDTTASATHVCYQGAAVFTAGQLVSGSVWLKSGERTFASIGSPADAKGFGINLTTGAIVESGVPGWTANTTARVIDRVGSWYRVGFTFTAVGGSALLDAIRIFTNNGSGASYTGDGVSGIYVWGAQLEVGAYASSYIPTTTAAVTRAAEVCLMTGANFSRWFNPLEGTIVAEFGLITNGLNSTGGNAFPHVYDFDSAAAPTSGHSLLASAGYGPGVRAQTQSAGVDQAAFNHAITLGTGAVMRHAYAYKTNDFAACLNGGAVATDALGILISPDRLAIGSMDAGGSNQLYGHLRRIPYWPRRLSNARLQELTA